MSRSVLFLLAIFTLVFINPSTLTAENTIKYPNVAGSFYPADAKELSEKIDQLFTKTKEQGLGAYSNVKMLIVPHAGYVYSGEVAAEGFRLLKRDKYQSVIIVAPSHYIGFDQASIWNRGQFVTPLGSVNVDEELADELLKQSPHFVTRQDVFDKEHALEVEIPFLQKSLHRFKIVPIILGQLSPETLKDLAASVNSLINKRDDVLVVISTDFSHYHAKERAETMDRQAIQAILNMEPQRVWNGVIKKEIEMCGFMPVMFGLLLAEYSTWDEVRLIKYAHSGDVTGDHHRVVGYASIVFSENLTQKEDLSIQHKRQLVRLAKKTVNEHVLKGQVSAHHISDGRLLNHEGAFVTIRKDGQLRGCIGNIISNKPLADLIQEMAVAAAVNDPRFKPVDKDELMDIRVEVSVLSKPRKLSSTDEIHLGQHGVILKKGRHHQGVFLPKVAEETGWDKEEFLNQLCTQKAGLAPGCWRDPTVELHIFSAQEFGEEVFTDEE